MALIGSMSGTMSGSLTHLGDGSSYLLAGSGISITSGSGAAVTIAASGGGGSSFITGTFHVPSPGEFVTTASLSVAGAKGHAYTADSVGGDVFFFVSGSTAWNATDRSVFGGNTFMSGALEVGSRPTETADGSNRNFAVNTKNTMGILKVSGSQDTIVLGSLRDEQGSPTLLGADTFFHVSGTIGLVGTDERGIACFGGDIVTSGTLYAADVTISDDLTVTDDANITGDLSVDGTANLDNTDIDGTFKMDGTTFDVNASGLISLTSSGGGVDVDAAGSTSIDGASGINIGTAADVAIDIDSSTLDIDASGAITIDGGSSFSVDAVGTSNITTNGMLTVSGSTGVMLSAGHGTMVVTGSAISVASSETFISGSSGLTLVSESGDITLKPGGGDVLPDGDATRNLGSASKRWANIYTGDLHLQNERGNWTMIEEPSYLSLRNNATGKVYRILMEEVTD